MCRMNRSICCAALVLAVCTTAHSQNWTQWRGPDGNGVSLDQHVPLEWDESKNIVWTCRLEGWGTSTPAVWDDGIYVTSHSGEKLLLHRVDWTSGAVVWTRQVGMGSVEGVEPYSKSAEDRRQQMFHSDHNLATPSPVTDGKHVIVHFGNGDLAAYGLDGQLQWKRNLQEDHGPYTIWWGHANSPVLFRDLVISVCMQDSLADLQDELSPSYIMAHDISTGEEKWQTMRMTGAESEPCDSYTPPLLRIGDGGWELIVMGGTQLDAYDPLSGRQLWYLKDLGGNRTITGPTVAGELVYATVGMSGPLLAVKLDGQGEVGSEAIAWQHRRGTPDTTSPVVWNDLLFFISDDGIGRCLDRRNGTTYWKQRLAGDYRASPVAVAGRIYFLNRDGLCTVIAAASEFRKLSENKLDDEFCASPAISKGCLFLRGKEKLYCVARRP